MDRKEGGKGVQVFLPCIPRIKKGRFISQGQNWFDLFSSSVKPKFFNIQLNFVKSLSDGLQMNVTKNYTLWMALYKFVNSRESSILEFRLLRNCRYTSLRIVLSCTIFQRSFLSKVVLLVENHKKGKAWTLKFLNKSLMKNNT